VLTALDTAQRPDASRAMASALLSLTHMRHRPVLEEAVRILKLNPDGCPGPIRAVAAFAVGVLPDNGKPPAGVSLFGMYNSITESRAAKFEAIKALGNLRHAPSADRLKEIYEAESVPEMRWIAHWSWQRAANTTAPFTPAIERREPPVSITSMSK